MKLIPYPLAEPVARKAGKLGLQRKDRQTREGEE